MARARNIKPGFFKNDLLAECTPLARILFAGMWCEADREGRLEDRPKRLKVEYLPYDSCDVDDLLNQLASRGFVVRYKIGEVRYICIVNFLKHQNPHVKEAESTIPAPDENSSITVQAGLIPLTLNPITDSLNLIPDSKVSTSDDVEVTADSGSPLPTNGFPACPTAKIIDLYHRLLPELPKVGKITPKRRGQIQQRWREDLQDLDQWENFFADVRVSDFLMGRAVPSKDRPPFRADIEFLTNATNFAKIYEGKYHR